MDSKTTWNKIARKERTRNEKRGEKKLRYYNLSFLRASVIIVQVQICTDFIKGETKKHVKLKRARKRKKKKQSSYNKFLSFLDIVLNKYVQPF